MTIPTSSIRSLLNQILKILQVEQENQRERMIDEVERFVQVKTILVGLKKLPAEQQKKFSSLSSRELELLLQQHIGEAEVKIALEKAVEETIPAYIAELTQTATPEQKGQIEALLQQGEK